MLEVLNEWLKSLSNNLGAVSAYISGVLVLTASLSFFGEVWTLLKGVSGPALLGFATIFLIVSFAVVLIGASSTARDEHNPSSRAPLRSVATPGALWWLFFLVISLLCVSSFAWIASEPFPSAPVFFMWGLTSVIGVSVESFKLPRGEGLIGPLHSVVKNRLDSLIDSVGSSGVVQATDFIEVRDLMVDVLENDPSLRVLRKMSQPIEEMAESIEVQGLATVPLQVVVSIRDRFENYYQHRLLVVHALDS